MKLKPIYHESNFRILNLVIHDNYDSNANQVKHKFKANVIKLKY